MKLYVCWNTTKGPFGHPCGNAYHALREAGHDPEVIKSYGLRVVPDFFNRTEGRREVERLTGRKVRAFISGVDTEAEGLATEMFVLHPAGYTGPSRMERADV